MVSHVSQACRQASKFQDQEAMKESMWLLRLRNETEEASQKLDSNLEELQE
jgi:hypothetical protein